jgi:hypothetical protein
LYTSHTLMVAFTLVFAVTGLYSLVRFAGLVSGAAADGDRVAELAHLLMSLAMIAMTWAYSGGPDTASGTLQIVVFGLLGLWFLLRMARPGHGHARETAYHLVMATAMVWMVAAMPVLMGGSGMSMSTSTGGGAHGDHASMAGMDDMAGMSGANAHGGMGMSGVGGPPTWARVITLAFVVLLVAAMAMWSSRLFRPAAAQVSPSDVRPTGPTSGPTTAVVTRPAPSGVARMTGPRLDAACHLLMSLGMAAALLAMP